jgi:UDP-4-amino-4,6-dideoxy-N-acetyl-beta-L-altrosamine N-acetyltransferase
MITTRESKPIGLLADLPDRAREWRNHPSIWRWCRQNTLLSEDDHRGWLAKIAKDPTIKMFGVFKFDLKNPDNSHFVGVCGFTSIDHRNKSAEFSLYISHDYHGHGYGRKALELLLLHGFVDYGFRRIWGEVFEENPAMEVFKKIGFKEDGVLRSSYWKAGSWIDSHMISILDTEWVEIQKAKPELEVVE